MSFADLLRNSRSKPIAALHKFLTNYDPNRPSVYGFVEGQSDLGFYRVYLTKFLVKGEQLFLYNCEGKRNVYDTHAKVVQKYPTAKKILFFVDKDVDDLVGTTWPSDPRVFVTECYSIENYVCCVAAVERYFADFVKIKKHSVDLSPMLARFQDELAHFHAAVRPIMCWIIAQRRMGANLPLADIDLGRILRITAGGLQRVRGVNRFDYLSQVTNSRQANSWRHMRQACRQLPEDAKRYVRGKFELWFLLAFTRRVLNELSSVVREDGGSISVALQLTESNAVQILVRGVDASSVLQSFLEFHLQDQSLPDIGAQAKTNWIKQMLSRVFR